jgi:hypothetical protein
MRLRLSGLVVLLLAVIALSAAGCGVQGDDGTSSTATPATTATPGTTVAQDTMKVSVYYSRDEKICPVLRLVPTSDDALAAAVAALLAGPTADETASGVASSIPEGTTLLGLEIKDGVATVDLSAEFASGGGSLSTMMRLAEVVFTLTQFPTVAGVELELAGEPVDEFGAEGLIVAHPMTRADFEALSPTVLIESPLPGETVSSPVRVRGTSNTFEATSLIKILDQDGKQIGFQVVTATSGTGQRGTFDMSVPFTVDAAGPGTIVTYEESAEDGSVINELEIPVQLAK